ncbi:MAG: CbbX protein [Cyanobacteria bacterium QS_8_64_29]|nr:MAG: CbbX protein [Cyanobacteria bacterium QS_8_64_29]
MSQATSWGSRQPEQEPEEEEQPEEEQGVSLDEISTDEPIDLEKEFKDARIQEVLDKLDEELVGLQPVKERIREIATLLLVGRIRKRMGLHAADPGLHMCFTGNPGTGKTTVATRMADILYRLGYVRKGHLVAVTRDDLVGEYIGHTAPKTKEVLKNAMGGVLFIDEAYYLYRPENERDYGQEAIEILLQFMENQRDDIVVILAGYDHLMEKFFQSNPGMRSRIAHHIEFPDFTPDELLEISRRMIEGYQYRFSAEAEKAFRDYIERRMQMPHFANARSVRNAIDRIRLRHAKRLFSSGRQLTTGDLITIESDEILASRVFKDGLPDSAQELEQAHANDGAAGN